MIKERLRILAIAAAVGVAAATVAAVGTSASADEDASFGQHVVRAQLSGYQEDPNVLSTTGNASFRLFINDEAQEITYRLSYSDLSAPITQSHIHFGGRHQSGGVSVFLCTNLGNGPVGTQLCPAAPATITGTIHAADVIGPAGQGIAAGEFAELVKAIRAGVTYANIHTSAFPGGEIRAQLNDDH